MSKFFRVTGLIYATISLGLFFGSIETASLWSVFCLVSGILTGLAFFTIGELVDRITDLEKNFEENSGFHDNAKEQDSIQKIICSKCKKGYDADYPKCPYCGTENAHFNS